MGKTVKGEVWRGSLWRGDCRGGVCRASRRLSRGICPIEGFVGKSFREGVPVRGVHLHCTAINCYKAKHVAHICR